MKFYFNIFALLFFAAFSSLSFAHDIKTPISNNGGLACPLPAPETLVATQVTANSVTLEWSPVPDAALYMVTIEDVSGGFFMFAQFTSSTNTTIGGLNPNTLYRFGVSASRCQTYDEAQYGPPIYLDIRTRTWIVDDLITGRNCILNPASQPAREFAVTIPNNQLIDPEVKFYQAQVIGGESFKCLFNITEPCGNGDFYVSLDRNSPYTDPFIEVECVNSCAEVEFINNQTKQPLFTLRSPNSIGGINKVTILFHIPTTGVLWQDNNQISCSVPRSQLNVCGSGWVGGPSEEETTGFDAPDLKLADLKLTPNPTREYSDLSMELQEPSKLNITLYGMLGNIINAYQSETLVPAGTFNHRIELAHLPPGMYFVNIQTKAGIKTEVLVKQ